MPSPSAPLLILDDNPGDRGLLRRVLVRAAPRRPLIDLGDPGAALDWIQARRGAGGARVILDWRLGVLDGGDVLADLRSRSLSDQNRVVILSGGVLTDSERQRAFALGADEVWQKPMTSEGWDRLATQILETPARPAGLVPASGRTLHPLTSDIAMSNAATAETLLPSPSIPGLEAIFERLNPEELFGALGRFFGARSNPAGSQVVLGPKSVRQEFMLVLAELCERHRLSERDALIGPQPGQEWSQDKRNRRRLVIAEMLGRGFPRQLVEEYFEPSRATLFRLQNAAKRKSGTSLRPGKK